MKPKILFAYRFGVLGGVATQLLNRYPTFSDRFDIRVLFEQDDGVTGRFPDGSAIALSDPAARVEYMRDLAADITVIIDSPSMLTNWQDAGRQGALVLEVHTTTANFSYLSKVELDSGIIGIITVSEYMTRLVRETPVGSAVPVCVVPNCLDDRWFAPIGTGEHAPSVVPVVWVGKLDGHKRVLSALQVLERILVELAGEVDAVPVLIGGYAAGSDRVRHVLKTVVNRPLLRERLQWFPRLDYSVMPGLLRNAGQLGGISLSTSRNESFGMSVAESIASGCRVVAPAVGALPEIVPPGMLYPDGDFSGAASLACAMLREPEMHRDTLLKAASELQIRMAPAATLSRFLRALEDFGMRF